MNKETIIALISKDIKDLEVLTQGFSEMDFFPKPLLLLAIDKAKYLTKNIELLSEIVPATQATTTQIYTTKDDVTKPKVHLNDTENKEQQGVNNTLQTIERNENPQETPIANPKDGSILNETKQNPNNIFAEPKAKETEYEAEQISTHDENEPTNEEPIKKMPSIEEKKTEHEIHRNKEPKLDDSPTLFSVTLGESVRHSTSVADTINKEEKTVATTINKNKISDLKSAITIGDRFRFQRELFHGEGEKMNQAINDLNNMKTLEDASAYIKKFNWADDNSSAVDFKEIISRKFID